MERNVEKQKKAIGEEHTLDLSKSNILCGPEPNYGNLYVHISICIYKRVWEKKKHIIFVLSYMDEYYKSYGKHIIFVL